METLFRIPNSNHENVGRFLQKIQSNKINSNIGGIPGGNYYKL
jgi:hypothetical protein